MRDDTVVTGQDGNGNKHADVAGWSVPGYTELKALGSGGSGDVVLARHDATGTLVAIKYLRRTLLADPQWAQLFRAEAQVLAYLDDPNIVRLYEYVESPSGAAIVMELVDGVSVREILAHQGGTTAEAALVVLRGSLLGLATAHRRGVVHRDYKPENVLVNRNGDSKLTDFGIAARTGAEPVAAGSLLYAPPEQFAGTPASPAGDIYAATATFYECLTGRPPFTGDTAEALLYQHLSQPVPLDPVPEPLRPLVAAGMAKEPGNRPADATAFVAGLEAIASRAYGPDWKERGRSHLRKAALLLALLWPLATAPAVQGADAGRPHLAQHPQGVQSPQAPQASQPSAESRHIWHLRHLRHLLHLEHLRGRRLSPVKAAVAIGTAAAVAAGVALAVGLTRHGPPPPSVTLPAVTGVSPAGGTDVGGTPVTITGTGLAQATRVTFGGVAGRITARSDTRITVASPPSTAIVGITVTAAAITTESGTRITGAGPPGTGTVDIIVTTPDGTSKPGAADHYTFSAPRPAVTGISPDSGSTAGGTTVSVTGTGLAGATAVTFGGVAGRITADSNTQVTVISPPGTGTVPVTATTAAGTSTTAAAGHYAYTARPKRTQSISFTAPAPAAAGGSAALSARGGGSGNPVVFSVDAASGPGVCTVSGRTITYAAAGPCVIDANQAGNATYAAAPQVQQMIMVAGKTQSITFNPPASGMVGGSATLSATGGGSGNPVVFSVDPAAAGACTVAGATVTYTAAGSCVINANQAGNGTYAAAPQAQQTVMVKSGTVNSGTKLDVTGVAPASGPAGGGTGVVITGGGFTGVTGVSFGGTPATKFTVDSAAQITATSPPGTGAVHITVTTPAGTSAVTASDQFTYVVPGPELTGISPGSGSTAGGTPVTLTGTNLAGATNVSFGGTTVTPSGDTGTTITVTSPPGNAGPVSVTVTTPAGTSDTEQFTYVVPGPVLTDISTGSGSTNGKTLITLTGTNLNGATNVSFGGSAGSISSDTATQITVYSPPGNAGTVSITVTTPAGTSNALPFTYILPAPTVSSLSPNCGVTDGGSSVTINGTNLAGATSVSFGGTPTTFTVNSATQITAASTPGTANTQVNVTVTTPGGTSNTVQFTYGCPIS